MKKILFLIPTLSHGGAEKVLVNLVNNMDKSKFEITVQTLFDVGENKQFLSEQIKYTYSFKRLFRGNSKVMKLFSPSFLFKHLIKEKYDIIVSYLEGPTARIVSGCDDKSVKLVSWIHCTYKDADEAARSFRNIPEAKKCYNKFDFTACVSNSVKESFVKVLEFKGKTGTLYNTIETKLISEKSYEQFDDIKLENDCFNICSVGKLIPVKAFDRLMRIHKRLLQDGIKNHLYIFGVGSLKDSLEKWNEENGTADTVTFAGYRSNPYKYVRKCDLTVCSSLSEGLSTAVTESLIVGTPVVTTRCSGMEELLGKNNEYGIITDNDEEALYEGIKRMLTQKGLLEHYANQAKIRAPYFSTENTTKAVEDMFLNL